MNAATSNRVVLITPYGIENRGVRYIAAVLRQGGFEPHLVFYKRWVNNSLEPPTAEEEALLARLVRDLDPLLVGIGFGAPYLQVATRLTQRLRETISAPILWGGVYPTVCPDIAIEQADYVCVGEGEYPTLELAEALLRGDDSVVDGIWSRNGGDVRKPPLPGLIQDLDALPFPEYMTRECWFIEDGRLRRTDPIAETVEYRIYPTRGCPYTCTYCHSHVMRKITHTGGKYYRYRSVENVMRELEEARRILPRIRRVKFDGDVFAFPRGWIDEFAASYRQRIGIPFELLTYPGELDEADYRKLKEAGLLKVQTGIQSGSERELVEAYGRRSTAADIRDLNRVVHNVGVEVVYDLIFDNPLATDEDKRKVVELLLELDHPYSVYMYSLTLFPRTKLAEELLDRGLVTEDDIEGRGTKSFRQFRVSLDYPRPADEQFWIALSILAAKQFVPRPLIRKLMNSEHLRRNPAPLVRIAMLTDLVKVGTLALRMLLDGELTLFKIRQYGSFKKVISQ